MKYRKLSNFKIPLKFEQVKTENICDHNLKEPKYKLKEPKYKLKRLKDECR